MMMATGTVSANATIAWFRVLGLIKSAAMYADVTKEAGET
jgi:hypothetical protein